MNPNDSRKRPDTLPTSADIAPAELQSPIVAPTNNPDALNSWLDSHSESLAADSAQSYETSQSSLNSFSITLPKFIKLAVLLIVLLPASVLGLYGGYSALKHQSKAPVQSSVSNTPGSDILDASGKTLHINFNAIVNDGKTLTATGNVVIQNTTDNSSVFKIQSASGDNMFVADAKQKQINIGDKPPGNVSLNVSGDITSNGALVSTSGYTLDSRGLSIGGVLVCTAGGCVSNASPQVPASPSIDVANLAYLNANQKFTGNITFGGTNSFTGSNTFAAATTFNAPVQVAGNVNSAGGFSVGGTAGASFSCPGGQLLQQAVVSGGIITSGSCVVIAGGTTPTLQQVYDQSAPASITLSSTGGGLHLQDALTPLGTNLFDVSDNAGTTTYFAVNNLGISVTGNVNTTGQYQVGGAQISSANLSDSASITKKGNAFNGANQLVQLTAGGILPVLSGANLTNLNASNVSAGTLSDTRLSTNVALLNGTQTFTGANTFNNASNSFAGSGSALTNLNATNVASGTLNDSRLSSNVTLDNGNNTFTGNNSFHLSTAALSVQDASSPLAGNLFEVTDNAGTTKYFAVSSAGATINGNDVCTAAGNCTGVSGGAIGGSGTAGKIAKFTGSGFTIGDSLISDNGTTVTVGGNINTTGQYQVNGSQISSANLSDSNNLALLNAIQTFTGANTFNNASNSFSGNGSGLTNVNAAQLNGQAGSYYTNATNINTGTLSDSRLSSNVALLNANQTFTGNNVFSLSTAGLAVQDAASPLGTNLFEVTSNAGTTKYFTVSATALQFNGNDVCTAAGNCTGVSGGAIGGSGTAGKIAKFTGSGFTVGDSLISDNGTTVAVGGVLGVNTITPTATLTIGAATQTLALQGDSSTYLSATSGSFTNKLAFTAPAVASHTITIPNAAGTVAVSASGPLALDAAGNLTCPTCLTSGGGGGTAGVDSVNTFTGDITLAGTTDQIIITPASGTLTFSLPQSINTTSSPQFTNINVTGQYQVNGSQISSSDLSDGSNLSKLNGTQTFTGANTFNNASNSFTGDGSGLSNVDAAQLNGQAGSYYTNASNISTGTLDDNRLSSNVALLNRTGQVFTGDNTIKVDSGSAFRVQDSTGSQTILDVDTTSGRLGVGTATPTEKITIANGNLGFSNDADPTTAPTAAVNPTAGNLNGSYGYVVTFVTPSGETAPSPASGYPAPVNQQIDLTNIPIGGAGVTARNIYRLKLTGGSPPWNLVATINDNVTTTYTDNLADGSVGASPSFMNSTGGFITLNGAKVLVASQTTILGYQAGAANVAADNSFIGYQSGQNNTTGAGNTATGYQSLQANTTGTLLAAFGTWSLQMNTTGSNNSGFGFATLIKNTTGSNNVAVGTDSLNNNTTASNNTAVGSFALSNNTTGTQNTSLGSGSLQLQTTGNDNTGLGMASGQRLTTGSNNTGTGAFSLNRVTTGSGNTALGYDALDSVTTGTNNTAVGYLSNVSGSNLTNATAIGANSVVSSSNSLVLGGTGANAVNVGIGTATPGHVLDVQGDASFKNVTNSTTAFQIQNASGFQLLNLNTVTSATNLITNPGFEIDTSGWTPRNSATISRTTSVAYMGAAAGQIDSGGNFAAGIIYNYTFLPDTTYSFSLYAMTSGASFSASLGWLETGATGFNCSNTYTIVSNGWTRMTCTFTTGATISGSYVFAKQTDSVVRSWYVDSARLEQSSAASAQSIASLTLNTAINSPALFQNATDSTTAFQIQNAAGSSNLFVADTLNNIIGIGGVATAGNGPLQVINNSQSVGIGTTPGGGIGLNLNNVNSTKSTFIHLLSSASGGLGFCASTTSTACSVGTDQVQLAPGGAALFRNSSNSTAAFQVQNASGGQVLTADTTTNSLAVNQGNLTVQGLSKPTGLGTVVSNTGGTLAIGSYTYEVSAANINGSTDATAPITAPTTTSTSEVTVSWGAVTNTTGYTVYRSTDGGTTWFSNTFPAATTSIVDDGTTYTWTSPATPPTSNTTGGKLTVYGNALFQNATNSTTAFQIQNAGGSSVLNVDTQNKYVGIGTSSPQAPFHLSVDGNTPISSLLYTPKGGLISNSGGLTTFQLLNASDTATDKSQFVAVRARGTTAAPTAVQNGDNIFSFQGSGYDGSARQNAAAIDFKVDNTVSAGNVPISIGFATGTSGANRTTVATLSSIGAATYQNRVDSTTAFQVQNQAGSALLDIDTADGYVINNGTTMPGNELQNPGFEASGTTTASGWTFTGTSTTATDANARTGNRVAIITANGAFNSNTSVKTFSVTAGVTYDLQSWVKSSAGANGQAVVAINWIDKTGTTFGQTLNTLNPSTTYSLVEVTATPMANAVAAQVYFGTSLTSTTGTWYFDDFQLVRATNTAPVVFENSANSTTAFQIQNASGAGLLNADTSNMRISIGSLGTAVSQLYVGGSVPTSAISSAAAGGIAEGVAIQGHYAYVINYSGNTLQVFDITNPAAPASVSSTSMGTANPSFIEVKGSYAYITNAANSTLQVWNISNPALPVNTGSVTLLSQGEVKVQGQYAYISTTGGLQIVDVTNPSAPKIVNTVSTVSIRDVAISGSYAYLTAADNTLKVVNIANPSAASVISSTATATNGALDPYILTVQGRYAYVSNYTAGKIQVFDVSNPSAPVSITTVSPTSPANKLIIQGKRLYALEYTGNRFQIFDISTPGSPSSIGSVTTGTAPSSMVIDGRFGYVTNETSNNLQIFDLGGSYIQQLEAGSAEVGNLNVDGSTIMAGDASIQGGLNVGSGGIQTAGNLGVNGNATIQGYTYLSGGHVLLNQPGVNSISHTNCTASTTYGYQVTAVSADGGETSGPGYYWQTNVGCATLSATSYLTPNWSAVAGASYYKVYRIVSGGSPSSTGVIGTTSGTSFNDTGLPGDGTTMPSIDTTGQLSVLGSSVFQTPTNTANAFQVQNSAGNSILNVDTSNSTVNISSASSFVITVVTQNAPTTSATGGSLAAATYYYKITAIDGAAEETAGTNEKSITTTGSTSTVTLSWAPAYGASVYRIYRSTASGAEKYLTSTTGTVNGANLNYTDTGSLSVGTASAPASSTYRYSYYNGPVSKPLQVNVGGMGTMTGQLYVSGTAALDMTAGGVPTGSAPHGIFVSGRYAYVTDWTANKLQVFSLSNPINPVDVSGGGVSTGSNPTAIYVSGHYAYVTDYTANKLQVFDVSNPASPTDVSGGGVATGSNPQSVYVQGRYAYVADINGGIFQIFDVSNPAAIKLVSNVVSASGPSDIYISGRYAYVLSGTANKLQIFDVSNPAAPTDVSAGGVATQSGPVRLNVSGRYVYVLSGTANKLQIFDVSNPASPTDVTGGGLATGTTPQGLFVQGRYAYVIDNGSSDLRTYDVSIPSQAQYIATSATGSNPYSLYVSGRYAYVVNAGSNTLQAFDLGGIYSQQLEAGGAEFGTLQVDNNGQVAGDFNIQGGLSVGQNLQAAGNVGIGGGLNAQGSVNLGGGNNTLNTPVPQTITPTNCSGSSTFGYQITAINSSGGETNSVPGVYATTVACATLNSTSYLTISWLPVTGATGYKVYRESSTGTPTSLGYIGSTTATSFADIGMAAAASVNPPATNTTGQLTVQGSALFKNGTDSTTAFQVQNSTGGNLLSIDSQNSNVVINGVDSGALGAWVTSTNPLLDNRYDLTSVIANGYIYAIGGQKGAAVQSTVYYAKLNADGTTGTWTTSTNPLPTNIQGHSSVVANGYLYVIGGNDGTNSLSSVYYARLNADGSTSSWHTDPNGLPAVLDSLASFVANGYVYALGGENTAGTSQSTVYYAKLNVDGTTGAWQTNANALSQPLRGLSAATANGYVYVLGGYGGTNQSTVYYAKLNADGSIGVWTTTTPMLQALRNHSSLISNGYIYVLGGTSGSSQQTVYFAKLNNSGTVGAWSTNTNALPVSMYGFGSATVNGYVYVVGGYAGSGQNTVYYASTSRLQVGSNLDLIGLQSGTLADAGDLNAVGGSLTAGNITAVGGLQVRGDSNLSGSLSLGGNLNAAGQALFQNSSNSTAAFQVQNAAGGSLVSIDSTNSNITLNGLNSGELSAWQSGTNTVPARGGQSTVYANGYAYMIGGLDAAGTAHRDTYYAKVNADGTIGTWNLSANQLPSATGLYGQASVALNGYIYVIGGSDNSTGALQTVSFARLNPDGSIGAWISATNLPAIRWLPSAVAYNGYIFVMGGADSTPTAQTTVYSGKVNADGTITSWTTLAGTPLPGARYEHTSVVANGYVYVMGGIDGTGATSSSVFYAKLNSDGTLGAWATSAATGLPVRAGGTSAVANGYIYLMDGVDATTTNGQNTVYYSKVGSNGVVGNWTLSGSPLPDTRDIASSFSANGYMYVLDGFQTTYTTAQATTYYASTSRIQLGGSIDLVGLAGGDLASNSGGGNLTAGNTQVIGSLQVQGQSNLNGSLSVSGNIDASGQALFQNSSNSTTAFQVQNANGTSLFTVNTSGMTITLGPASSTPVILVLGTKNDTAADPACTNGGIYYNSVSNRFRACANGTWSTFGALAPGYEISYDQITANVSLTATTEAGADTAITSTAFNFDGNTTVMVDVYVPNLNTASSVGLGLWLDGVEQFGHIYPTSAGGDSGVVEFKVRVTPTSGSHTFTVRGWDSGGAGTLDAGTGTGGASTYQPAYIRVTAAN